ncbi:MAG: hypothetical protein AAB610_00565 [Patescibacteria group bacterium]
MTIFNFLKFKNKKVDISKVIEKQLQENIEVIKSLRDYDEGKKDISTADLERRLPNIRVSPRA